MRSMHRARPPVKPTRRGPRPERPFGAGVWPATRPDDAPFEPSPEDARWAAATSPSAHERYDVARRPADVLGRSMIAPELARALASGLLTAG